ncbi:hypothetical protein M422DRAFT_271914 [Sphaerobolus stellatus SS14]|uniref:Uncharacterized protein n=1 Tax=Sphaerobolus stellatus (strain SS14) TaxID=990650 RepID=A0A0C9TCR4_SPHS4|nr:hypothetical protein M422DRAFT_271914 [Sphaerobolus stellatus SS14]
MQNRRDIAPNTPRIYPILLPEVDVPSVGARTHQVKLIVFNALPTPRGGFIRHNDPAPQQRPLPATASPPNASRMRTIPLPDV